MLLPLFKRYLTFLFACFCLLLCFLSLPASAQLRLFGGGQNDLARLGEDLNQAAQQLVIVEQILAQVGKKEQQSSSVLAMIDALEAPADTHIFASRLDTLEQRLKTAEQDLGAQAVAPFRLQFETLRRRYVRILARQGELDSEIQLARDVTAQPNVENAQLRTELQAARQQLTQLREHADQLLAQARSDLAQAQTELKQERDLRQSAEAGKASSEQALSQVLQQARQAEEALQQASLDMTAQQQTLENQHALALTRQSLAHGEQLEALEALAEQNATEREALRQQLVDTQQALRDQQLAAAEQQDQYEALQAQFTQDVAALETALATAQQAPAPEAETLADARLQLEAMRTQLAALQADAAQQTQKRDIERSMLLDKMAQTQTAMLALEQQAAQLTEQNRQLQSQLVSEQQARAALVVSSNELQAQLAQARSALRTAQDDASALTAQNSQLQAQLDQTASLTAMQQDWQQRLQQAKTQAQAKLEATIKAEQDAAARAQQEQRRRIVSLEQALEAQNQQVARLQAQQQIAEQDLTQAQNRQQQAQAEIARLSKQVADQRAQNQNATQQAASHQTARLAFAPGRSQISSDVRQTLSDFLAAWPQQGCLMIQGSSDDTPLSARHSARSNVELATRRAISVARTLAELAPDRKEQMLIIGTGAHLDQDLPNDQRRAVILRHSSQSCSQFDVAL